MPLISPAASQPLEDVVAIVGPEFDLNGTTDDVDTLVALGWTQRALGHTDAAEAAFARARKLEPNYPNLPRAP